MQLVKFRLANNSYEKENDNFVYVNPAFVSSVTQRSNGEISVSSDCDSFALDEKIEDVLDSLLAVSSVEEEVS